MSEKCPGPKRLHAGDMVLPSHSQRRMPAGVAVGRKEKADRMMREGFLSRFITVGSLAFLTLSGALAQAAGETPMAPRRTAFAQVPLYFERNMGQVPGSIEYIARGQGYDVALAKAAATLAVRTGGAQATIQMRPVGASPSTAHTMAALPGRANYLLGNDKSKWVTNVPTYARVVYRSVYPGIDLVYYGNRLRLQYDFVVSPGSDPSRVRLAFDGASSVSVTPDGGLLLQTPAGTIRHARPHAYQTISGRQVPVPARFVARKDGTLGFRLARYDASKTLVIDPLVVPVLESSTFLGGSGDDGSQAVAVDSSGNVYVASWTNSGNFPIKAGSYDTSINGNYDVVVSKISPDLKTLLYSTYLGGSGNDFSSAIVVKGGNAIVVGDTDSSDFPVTAGVVQGANAGGTDGFITELNATGTALVASTYVGGSGYDTLRSVALDPSTSRVAVTGWTNSPNFPTTPGAFQTSWPAGLPSSAFATVLVPSLTAYHFSSYLHGTAQEQYGTGVTVDNLGRVVVVGRTNSTTFPVTPGAFQTSIAGESDAFVTMFDASGGSLVWSTLYGGKWTDGAEAVAIDPNGNVCFVGRADSNDLPLRGAYQGANAGRKDAFFAAIEPGGAVLHWGTYLGGDKDDIAYTLTQDANGRMYITGETWSSNFPVTAGAYQSVRSGLSDAFVVKIRPTGAGVFLEYSTYLGGSGQELATGAACDAMNQLIVSGVTTSSNYPVTPGVVKTTYGGGPEDGFVTRFALYYAATTLYTIDRTGTVGEPVILRSYDLRRIYDNTLLAGQTINFKIDGTTVGSGTTDAGGDANYTWIITPGPTTRTITAEFPGNDPYLPSSANATLTAQVWATKMATFDRTARITDTTELKCRLVRSDNVPIYNKGINFYVDGTFIVTRYTDVNGYARWPVYTVPDGAGAGTRIIKSEWLGDAGYLPVTKNANLTVLPALPYIWVLSKTVGHLQPVSLYAYFRRLYDYQPQPNKPVTWKVDGTPIHSMNTNASGVASFIYWTTEAPGTHTLTCEFAGDAYVAAGSGNGTLTILP